MDGTLPKPGTVCEPIGTPFPIFGRGDNMDGIEELMANMTSEERSIYITVSKLSQNGPITPSFPFLLGMELPGISSREGKGCYSL